MASIISASTTSATALNLSGDTTGILQLATGVTPTTAVTIDASQNVGINTTVPRSKFETVSGNANTNADIAGTVGAFVGATGVGQGSQLSIESNDTIAADTGGVLGFGGRYVTGNTGYANWASIKGLKYDSVSGNYGGYLSFWTRLNGGSNIERMRIDTSGNVFIGGTTQNTATAPIYSNTTAKAWVNFNGGFGNTAGIINASFNVSSITVGGTGSYTVNFTNAMVDVKYSAVGSCVYNDTTSMLALTFFTQATTSISVKTNYQNATLNATTTNSIAVFR